MRRFIIASRSASDIGDPAIMAARIAALSAAETGRIGCVVALACGGPYRTYNSPTSGIGSMITRDAAAFMLSAFIASCFDI